MPTAPGAPRWIQNMPDWTIATWWFIVSNLVLFGGAVACLYYSEGVLVNGTDAYSADDAFPFQDFTTRCMTAVGACFLIVAILGVGVGGVIGSLNHSRMRVTPERIACDLAFDILAGLYVFGLSACLVLTGTSASISTYLEVSSNDIAAECPETFEYQNNSSQNAAPLSQCAFDDSMNILVNGAIGSDQLFTVWNAIQSELNCCGYWCPEGNSSLACRQSNLWQMENCQKTASANQPTCRDNLITVVSENMWIAAVVSWVMFFVSVLMIAFFCHTRTHVVNLLDKWVN